MKEENFFFLVTGVFQVDVSRGGVVLEISSVQNPRIKEATRLKERRARNKSSKFLLEGVREIERAVAAGVVLEEFYFCPALLKKTLDLPANETISCSEQVFSKLSYREHPDGAIAVARVPTRELPIAKKPLYLVVEGVEKPGNLGAILRSADATAVTGVIVCGTGTDCYNPNVIRASTGTLFTQPVVELSQEKAFAFLSEQKVTLLAAMPAASELYTSVDMDRGLAIVVGTEAEGLSDFWKDQCDVQVGIPMLGTADSLNVATATSLLLYEAVRQRY